MAGVVKNLLVRVGADLSGLVSGFKKGGASVQSFKQQASSEIKALSQEYSKMESAYDSILKATERVNLGTPVSKQIAALEKDRSKLMTEAEKAAGLMDYWSEIEPPGLQFKTEEAASQLDSLDLQIRNLSSRIKELQSVADLGASLGLDDVSAKTLQKLQQEIQQTKQKIAQFSAESAQKMTKFSMSSIGAKDTVEGLLKSIKKLGIVSFGLNLVKSAFGELGAIVRQYISENEALQAQTNALKSSLGQALAPAINLVTNALSQLMPCIIGVSNAISSLITSLFGAGWTNFAAGADSAAKAVGGAGAAIKRSLYGFDEITKLDDKSGGGGGSSVSSAVASIEGALPDWVTSWVELFKQSIDTGDWSAVGEALSTKLSEVIADLDLTVLMKNLPSLQKGLTTFFEGWFSGLSWESIGEFLKTNIEGFFENFDLGSVIQSGIKSAFSGNPIAQAAVDVLFGNMEEYFAPYIEKYRGMSGDLGTDLLAGILAGIGEGIAGIGVWLYDNVLEPLVEGFKKVFDIHSPSEHPEIRSIGKNIILGVFEGILEIAKSPLEWIKTNVFTPIQQAMQSLFDGTVMAKFTVGVKNTATTWWSNVKTWWSQKVSQPVQSFTTNVKNDATTWWQNVKTWWNQKVAEPVASFKTGVINDATTWWENVKGWWDANKGTLLMNAFVRDESKPWWENVKGWWDANKGTLLMNAFIRDESKTWWENVKTWWGKNIGELELKIKLPEIKVEWGQLSALGQTFNYPKKFYIDWNARGAILNGAQLFGMAGNHLLGGGEAGREAVLPLDRHTGWMDDIADRVAARMGSSGTQEQQITVNVPLDGKILASTVVRVINGQARATGHNPLSAYI